jgi:hypothetical protein
MSTATLTRQNRATGAKAASVSRTLAQAGVRPLPSGTSRMREGVRVRRSTGDRVLVSVDLDSANDRMLLEDEIVAVLRAEGFSVEILSDSTYAAMYVTHPRIAL